jgi:hypothetical protein
MPRGTHDRDSRVAAGGFVAVRKVRQLDSAVVAEFAVH